MSDTPRTDAILRDEADSWADTAVRLARLATTLERELAAANARVAELEAHEAHTHKELGAILGTDDALRVVAQRMKVDATPCAPSLRRHGPNSPRTNATPTGTRTRSWN